MAPAFWAAGLVVAVAAAAPAAADEAPKYGGILTYMIPADSPPSFDAQREETYATIHSAAPFYSVLIRINPNNPESTTDIVCLALRVETRRRVRRDHVGQYTAVFRRLVGRCRRCRREGDAQASRPERWCHRFPPVPLDRVARPVPSSYSGNTKMPIVLASRLSSEARPARRTHSLTPTQAQQGILLTGPENMGSLPTRFLIPPARSAEEHEHRFPPPRVSGRCGSQKRSFAADD